MGRLIFRTCKFIKPSFRELIFETENCYGSPEKIRFTRQQRDFILSENVQNNISDVIETLEMLAETDVEGYVARHHISYGNIYEIIWKLTVDELNFSVNVEKCFDGNIKIRLNNDTSSITLSRSAWKKFNESRDTIKNFLNREPVIESTSENDEARVIKNLRLKRPSRKNSPHRYVFNSNAFLMKLCCVWILAETYLLIQTLYS